MNTKGENKSMYNGTYAIYKGKKYNLGKRDGEFINLVSRNRGDTKAGFVQKDNFPTYFIKKIEIANLEAVYNLKSYALYRGYRFQIVGSKGNEIIIFTADDKIAEQCNMECLGRREYKRFIDKSEVEIIKEVEEITLD